VKHPREVMECDWQSLDEGETVRIRCKSDTCRDKIKAALTVTRTLEGAIYNCYRCGLPGYPLAIFQGSNPSTARRKIEEIRNGRRKMVSNDNNYRVTLPRDFTLLVDPNQSKHIPAAAYAWLYKYELTDDDIYEYNIGYSARLDRVIIPIYDNDKLIAWQGRDINYTRNKELHKRGILNKSPLKYYMEYNKYTNNNNKLYFKLNYKHNLNNSNIFKYIILVEDILSCIKLYNKFGYNCVALLNSTVHDKLIKDLALLTYNKVYLWLDWDKQIESIKYVHKLRSAGVNAISVRTIRDPKAIPYKEIKL
jgi:hypothetical protein